MLQVKPRKPGKHNARAASATASAGEWAILAAVLGIVVILLCEPLLVNGPLPRGSDVFATCHYLQGFMKAFGEGDLLPRWTDRSNQGLGAPSFVLFPPLTFYGAGIASWITGSIISGFKLYMVLLAILTGCSFYALARFWIGPGAPAAVASGLYLLLPYHVLDMYQRFAMSELTSFLFFPLILLFARRVMENGRRAEIAGLAIAYAALVYTHIVSAFLFSLMLGLWLLWEGRGRWKRLAPVALGLAWGLMLAAPALLPAVLEKRHVNIAWVREMPNGDFRINTIFRDDVLPGLGIKDPVKPPVLRSAHSQLLLAIAAAAIALGGLRGQGRARKDVVAMLTGCGIAYFLQTGLSTPVWLIVPELRTIQFPWRFQTVMVLTTALLAGSAIAAAWRPARGGGARRPAALLALAALIGVNLYFSRQNAFLKPFDYDEAVNGRPSVVEWTEPSTTPIAFTDYRSIKGMTLDMPRAAFVQGAGNIRIDAWESSSRRLSIDTTTGGTIVLRTFWFPGWEGSLDGSPLELSPSDGMGAIRFGVPAGSHTVSLSFEATAERWGASLLGMVSGLALLLLCPPLSKLGRGLR